MTRPLPEDAPTVAVIGAGPAGLMAAERLAQAGL
ncbi:NAD(P)/FAD-dependent oxidoreductase, partial [Brucella abortus]